jgi:transformation/transcription domain-associated protein
LAGLRQIQARPPDAKILGQFFTGAVNCLALFKDRDPRDEKEAMDLFAAVWNEVSPHTFQDVWTSKMDFFFEQTLNHTSMLSVAQSLFELEQRTRQFVSITLRHFTDRLDTLGNMETKRAAVTIRFMKMAFNAVTQFPEANESLLAPHLGRLIMDSFPLAAKSSEPSNYFLLLKGLFRAIGGGQGRFEQLYKEVLPLLPEMLDSLSRMLNASEPGSVKRDLLIELSLTVPVRLAHLLKFLHYLMTPLVCALEGSTELVTQGLRTLELMVDNLTPEFLDPTLQPVLRELMTALSRHLKPLPMTPHQHSHTIIRTLGKLGGRNRRLLERHPHLSYNSHSERSSASLSISGRPLELDLTNVIKVGVKAIRDNDVQFRSHAFDALQCVALLMSDLVNYSLVLDFGVNDTVVFRPSLVLPVRWHFRNFYEVFSMHSIAQTYTARRSISCVVCCVTCCLQSSEG